MPRRKSPKNLPYDPSDRDSILQHALLLLDKSLGDFYDRTAYGKAAAGGKGDFGLLVESLHFGIQQNSISGPDFPEAEVELKTHPIEKYKRKIGYRPKERLVFSKISYMSFTDPKEWNLKSSSFWRKNKFLLLLTYLYEADRDVFDYIFKIIRYFEFSDGDLKIIEDDWKTIVTKIKAGKAHLLSGGDTMYLEACTKGGRYVSQPFGRNLAISRAFALKPSFLKTIIDRDLSHELIQPVVKTVKEYRKNETFEQLVLRKIAPYLGESLDSICKVFQIELTKSKDKYAGITDKLLKSILGVKKGKIAEFEKGDVLVRTCRLEKNGSLREHVSFPAFRYMSLVNEKWIDSEVRRILESRFFFVFFREYDHGLVLEKARFWTMPVKDLESVRSVWNKTVEVVQSGSIINYVKGKRRFTNFPKSSEHPVAHVRPHATRSTETYPIPVPERTTGARSYTKHSFWLNKSYVVSHIYK